MTARWVKDPDPLDQNPLADLDLHAIDEHISAPAATITTPPRGQVPLAALPAPATKLPVKLRHTPPAQNPLLLPSIGQLTIELAAAMEPVPDILTRYNVSMETYRRMMTTPAIRETIRDARARFTSLGNTAARIKVKAQLLLEMSLPEIWDIVSDPSIGAAARVAAFGSIKSLTGLEKPEVEPVAAKFSLTINVAPGSEPDVHVSPETITVPFEDETEEGGPPAPPASVQDILDSLRELGV
jgi:hypothetical protein